MFLALAASRTAVGQETPEPSGAGFGIIGFPAVDGQVVDRTRAAQLAGLAPLDGFLLRSPSTLLARTATSPTFRLDLIAPTLGGVWNSALPNTRNGGALWAGRGLNASAVGGFRLLAGPLTLVVAPEVTYSANEDADFLRDPYYPDELPPNYQALWYQDQMRIDLPYRFGTESITETRLGQSSLSLAAGPVTVGAGTESHWWGPGIQNAIVLSTNAPGFEHVFVRPTRPVSTGIGTFDGRWLLGRLESSDYFEAPEGDETTAIGAVALTFRPVFEPNLTLGLARGIYGPGGAEMGHRVLTHWQATQARASKEDLPDHLLSLFGRWVVPSAGAEVYAEWARRETPGSFRDLLVHPNHSQGYTLGFQWARPALAGVARVQAEATNLEMATTFRTGRTTSYYVSYARRQGYTHQGRVLGASIGPGASSQWLAADFFADAWELGAFAGRIRWDNDAMYTAPWALLWGVPYHGHDVSVLGGVRGGVEAAGVRVGFEWTAENRMNYLFQNWSTSWETTAIDAVDILNHRLRLSVSPATRIRVRR